NGFALPVLGGGLGSTPRISSLLIKPVSAVCNLDCAYCFYLDRDADPYKALPARRVSEETLERLVDGYLFYSYPHSVFAFQGGEPTLAGPAFFEKLVGLQQRSGRGHAVSNALQTNGMLLDDRWCRLFKQYSWLLGVSLDGPQPMHDLYRFNKQGKGTWSGVMQGIETLKKHGVEFNILCVLSQANVDRPREVYSFFRSLGFEHMQFIPLSEFDGLGQPLPFTIRPEQYGRFLCEVFDLWWPERRKVRVRFFDNIAEALAGQKPGACTLHETCDSYAVVEFNGDVYPCDFFVEKDWKIGNIHLDSWPELSRRQQRYRFASKKTLAHAECQVCEFQPVCHGGCPKHRHDQRGRFEDLDYFCSAYKMIYQKSLSPLRREIAKILAPPAPQRERVSPY
ncbi:MAG: anaerobic sulfatase maturase, partial [Acidobacteria bacterium]|nr:anaerobic sulfatase maturase [Acidobacteriota bacterium]